MTAKCYTSKYTSKTDQPFLALLQLLIGLINIVEFTPDFLEYYVAVLHQQCNATAAVLVCNRC